MKKAMRFSALPLLAFLAALLAPVESATAQTGAQCPFPRECPPGEEVGTHDCGVPLSCPGESVAIGVGFCVLRCGPGREPNPWREHHCRAPVHCAGGTEVADGVCDCPANLPFDRDGQCEAEVACLSPSVRNADTNRCECPPPNTEVGGACRPPPIAPSGDYRVSAVAENTDCAPGSDCDSLATARRGDVEFTSTGDGYSALGVVKAEYAHARGFTGRGVTVAVVDSGIDGSHREFAGRITLGYNALAPLLPPFDVSGHGTRVAGVLAAARDGIGTYGVAYDSTIIPIRHAELDPRGHEEFSRAIAHGITSAFVMNNSWGPIFFDLHAVEVDGVGLVNYPRPAHTLGGIGFPQEREDGTFGLVDFEFGEEVLLRSFLLADDYDRVVVFAAGNEGWNTETGKLFNPIVRIAEEGSGYENGHPLRGGDDHLVPRENLTSPWGLVPADYPEVLGHWLVVVAVDESGQIASLSNGCGPAKNWCMAAPGVSIRAPHIGGFAERIENGTSYAAPHVSGAAAVLKGAFPNLSAKQVVTLLLLTAKDLGAAGVDEVYGWGLLDLEKATRPQTHPSCGAGGYACPGGSGLRLAALRAAEKLEGLELADFALADLGDSRIAPSPAFGDAFLRTTARAGFVDAYDRAYRIRLSGLAGAPPLWRGDAARAMRAAHGMRVRELEDGFFTRETGEGFRSALGWRGRRGILSATILEARNWRRGRSEVGDAAFALGARRWRGAELEFGKTGWGFRLADFSGRDSALRQWFANWKWAGAGWGGVSEFGVMDERDGVLGGDFSGGFASGDSRTFYGRLNGSADLGPGVRGFAGGLLFRTLVSGGGGGGGAEGFSAASNFSDLTSGGWEMGLAGERWRFSLWRPAGVLSGEMRMVGVSGYDDAGKYRAAESRVDLSARHPHRLTFAAGDASGNFWWSAEKALGGATRFSVLGGWDF